MTRTARGPGEMALLAGGHLSTPLVPAKRKSSKKRVMALDAFRGFNVMLISWTTPEELPSNRPLPWNGATLADMVMPWFDFMVGVSIALLQAILSPPASLSLNLKAAPIVSWLPPSWRFIKIFLLGMFTQGCKDMFVCDLPGYASWASCSASLCAFGCCGCRTLHRECHKTGASSTTILDSAHLAVQSIPLALVWLCCAMYSLGHHYVGSMCHAFGETCGRGVWTPHAILSVLLMQVYWE